MPVRSGVIPLWTSHGCSIWIFSVSGEPPHKIRDEATGDSISPDGSLFLLKQTQEEWRSRNLGDAARWGASAKGL